MTLLLCFIRLAFDDVCCCLFFFFLEVVTAAMLSLSLYVAITLFEVISKLADYSAIGWESFPAAEMTSGAEGTCRVFILGVNSGACFYYSS